MYELPVEKIEEFHLFLTGHNPEGIYVDPPLKISPDNAFTIIWYLQEHLRIIPDHYEMCSGCGDIYDSHCQGYRLCDDTLNELISDNYARWATHENYCSGECLQAEINRQENIIFQSFEHLKWSLKQKEDPCNSCDG